MRDIRGTKRGGGARRRTIAVNTDIYCSEKLLPPFLEIRDAISESDANNHFSFFFLFICPVLLNLGRTKQYKKNVLLMMIMYTRYWSLIVIYR